MDHRQGPVTDRLVLRAMVPADAEAFHRLNSHPEVMLYTGEPPMPSVEAAREAIERYPDWEDPGYGRWACLLRDAGPDAALIGFCGLKLLPETGEVDLGYRFLPEYWGRGLATEAGRASLEYGFTTLALHEIVALVLPENEASIRVLTKLGMRCTGDIDYLGDTVQRWAVRRQDAVER
ncbi:MAG: GNAT family N-acetyltransferase [Deltaproteobacteria bacterium]|nr:GNAT family N-acetyltransferase [Deltaproteobacteria bacterium]